MNYFTPFKVKLRSNLENRKNKKDWPFKTEYAVLAMDVERVSSPKLTDIDQLQHPLSDSNDEELVEGDGIISGWDPDEEDEEEMEDLLKKYNEQHAGEQQVRTWLLIANHLTGDMKWITSEEVKFTSS